MWRWTRRIALVLLLGGVGLVIVVGTLTRSVPEWYEPPSAKAPEVIELADRVEYRLVEETQKIRPQEERWTLRVREPQVNAWLAVRLPDWIAHEKNLQWPAEVGMPQVHIGDDVISLALPVEVRGFQRVVVAHLVPRIEGRQLWLQLRGIQLGGISVPGDPIPVLSRFVQSGAAGNIDNDDWQRLVDILTGREPIDPVLELSDRRRIELLDVRFADGALDLTSQTQGSR